MKVKHWRSQGIDIPFREMDTDHLENCLGYCKRKGFYGDTFWLSKAEELRKELFYRYKPEVERVQYHSNIKVSPPSNTVNWYDDTSY